MISFRLMVLAGLLAICATGCANRGMQAPGSTDFDAGLGTGGRATGGSASGGGGGEVNGNAGRGGGSPGSGGVISTGGATASGAGGLSGSGGVTAAGGGTGPAGSSGGASAGTGGAPGASGTAGATGGAGVGGAVGGTGGLGGATGTGGTAGAGTGAAGSTGGGGGATGTGGAAGVGGGLGGAGAAGGIGGRGGAATGSGGVKGGGGTGGQAGRGGAGGASGAGGLTCSLGGSLDCSSSGALKLPGGQVTDFSPAQWNAAANQFCDASGLRGHVFAYSGASPSAATATVDATAQNLKLDLTVGALGYAGGGLIFESCVNASAFTSIQFTASVTSGSLTGCLWQVQLQTQDQRDETATDPTGGTCAASCYQYPAAPNLGVPATGGSTYTEAFTAFSNPTSSTIATPTQVTGIQWQLNSGSQGTGTCTAEFRIDNITFH